MIPRDMVIVSSRCADLKPAHPRELELIHRRPVTSRRLHEFTLGRRCAQTALARLGAGDDAPVLRGESGEPLWPTGVVGSISHADGLCVAVVAAADRYRSIGVDVERSQRDIVELSDWILADAERQEDGRDIAVSGLMARFGAKESAIKCAFPLTQRVIEFNQLVVRLDIQAQRYSIRTANALDPDAAVFAAMEGRYAQDRQHNFCVSYVPASGRVRALRTAGA